MENITWDEFIRIPEVWMGITIIGTIVVIELITRFIKDYRTNEENKDD